MVAERKRKQILEKLEFRYCLLEKTKEAYLALLDGGVQSYSIGSRSLTKFDLPDLWDKIKEYEDEIEELESMLEGGAKRKSVGVVPRDW